MQNFRRCLLCKQVFVEGDLVCNLLPKCPHCGSKLTTTWGPREEKDKWIEENWK